MKQEKIKLNLFKLGTSGGDEPLGNITTGNLALATPASTDTYNIAIFNQNMQKIDEAITALQNNALTFVKTGEF